jgi:hypothetical protein
LQGYFQRVCGNKPKKVDKGVKGNNKNLS